MLRGNQQSKSIPSKEKYQNSLSFCALETGISFDAMWAT